MACPKASSSPLVPTVVATLSARDAPSFGFLPTERDAAAEVRAMNPKRREFSKLPVLLQRISAGAISPPACNSRETGSAQRASVPVRSGTIRAQSANIAVAGGHKAI